MEQDQPKVVYPIGKHIGIRDLGPSRHMDFLKAVDYDREITGIYLSGYGNRRYMAVSEKRQGDNNVYLLIYDMKSHNFKNLGPKYVINISDVAYGHSRHRNAQDAGADGQRDPPRRFVASLCFSKDTKYLAVLVSDQYMETKAVIYDIQK